ncbi:sensor histidine kinase [Pseudoalteromonas denitrificans]|uniref:histidine kinase n=1 Tax=Pseudoalteromonas denitrificans DSM 6059 TaxID=1123010 RepID=A0A1I1N3H0_9GAMM|nr:HAMP domain-containing sensor histidine kinase [Pseudoalteromonas denitrificans]SFC91906.1 Signal transduction histidine kinase [Pseudoalteromonas denitrificans DSM 6059]
MTLKFHKPYSLARRIMIQFCAFSVLLSVVFSFYNFIFLYTLEDSVIEKAVKNEVRYLKEHFDKTHQWAKPRKDNMVLHFNIDTFPEVVKKAYRQSPNEREFYGENGLHYHMQKIQVQKTLTQSEIFLLAEVSQQLVVRPLRSIIIKLLLVSTLILTLIACFIGYRLSRHLVQPLTKLVNLVQDASPQDLPKSFAHHYPNNEIGILANTLENSMVRINNFVLREQHFTRDASHELRTPIAIIKNATELLETGNLTETESQVVVKRISRASLQMEQTVNTLLSLAREEHTNVTSCVIKILPLVEKAIVQHAYLLNDKPVEVEVNISANESVNSQLGIVQILIANLISNAFSYTTEGKVIVCFEHNALSVFNSGDGIENSIQDSVLEPLVKGENSQGFGLGLSIVKRLCEHHKLTLQIESQNEGLKVTIEF